MGCNSLNRRSRRLHGTSGDPRPEPEQPRLRYLLQYFPTYNRTDFLGFLRAMETCQSILFLTTNRVGSFDDAFISRIHISLYYPDFSEADRKKVWWNFFGKLAKERGDVMRVQIDTKDYTQGQEVRAVKWNGREIRNG